jgi:hypothetical protein
MKNAIIYILFIVCLATACKKDEIFLKQELSIELINETDNEFEQTKIYSGMNFSDDDFIIADSILVSIGALSTEVINWRPKVNIAGNNGADGEFRIILTEDKWKGFGYYNGGSLSGSGSYGDLYYYTIIINDDNITTSERLNI